MTTAIIPVLAAMYLGSTFDLVKYQKGNADVFDQKTLEGNLQVLYLAQIHYFNLISLFFFFPFFFLI